MTRRLLPCGEQAVLLECAGLADTQAVRAVLAEQSWPEIEEVVTGAETLLLRLRSPLDQRRRSELLALDAPVLDPAAEVRGVVTSMSEAAEACRPGALTLAQRDADTPVGPCRAGQWLGIVDGAITAVGDELDPVARVVLDELWHDEAEVLTVVVGATARPGDLDTVLSDLTARHAGAEVVRIEGGQPTYPYLLGVE